jgi:hypothetical protein
MPGRRTLARPARSQVGVGSRFRATTNHLECMFSENDRGTFRNLRQNTRKSGILRGFPRFRVPSQRFRFHPKKSRYRCQDTRRGQSVGSSISSGARHVRRSRRSERLQEARILRHSRLTCLLASRSSACVIGWARIVLKSLRFPSMCPFWQRCPEMANRASRPAGHVPGGIGSRRRGPVLRLPGWNRGTPAAGSRQLLIMRAGVAVATRQGSMEWPDRTPTAGLLTRW